MKGDKGRGAREDGEPPVEHGNSGREWQDEGRPPGGGRCGVPAERSDPPGDKFPHPRPASPFCSAAHNSTTVHIGTYSTAQVRGCRTQ